MIQRWKKVSKFTRFVSVGSLDDMFDFLVVVSATRNRGSAGESFRFSWKPETETRGATVKAQACNLPAARRGPDSNGIYTILLLLGLLDPLLLVFLDLDVQALAMHFKMRSISCDFAYEESYLEIFPTRENSENPRDS